MADQFRRPDDDELRRLLDQVHHAGALYELEKTYFSERDRMRLARTIRLLARHPPPYGAVRHWYAQRARELTGSPTEVEDSDAARLFFRTAVPRKWLRDLRHEHWPETVKRGPRSRH